MAEGTQEAASGEAGAKHVAQYSFFFMRRKHLVTSGALHIRLTHFCASSDRLKIYRNSLQKNFSAFAG